jgi:hypothetical protein
VYDGLRISVNVRHYGTIMAREESNSDVDHGMFYRERTAVKICKMLERHLQNLLFLLQITGQDLYIYQ